MKNIEDKISNLTNAATNSAVTAFENKYLVLVI